MSTPAAPVTPEQVEAYVASELPGAQPIHVDPVPMYKLSEKFHGWFFEFAAGDLSGIVSANQYDGCRPFSLNLALFGARSL